MKTIIDAVNEFKGDLPKVDEEVEHVAQIIMAAMDFDEYKKGDITTGSGVSNNGFWNVICTAEEFNQCVDEMSKAEWIKPVTLSPIYTQEMADNDVLPVVGMKLNISFVYGNTFNESVITYMGDGVGCYRCKEGEEYTFATKSVLFSPITPPIELIDGKAYQFDYHDLKGLVGVYFKPNEDGFDILKGTFGSINAPLAAKNIQLLEVK